MRSKADVVIIGGGIAGCSIAFHLAKKGFKNIVVVEKSYSPAGGTGRCAAGFRTQWGDEFNCRISLYSVEAYKHLNEETGYQEDIEFIQDGYMFTVHNQDEFDIMKQNQKLQNSLGIPTQCLSPEEAKEMVPILNTGDGFIGGFFNHEDGHLNPFRATFAYKFGAQQLGVEFENYTTVLAIETKNDKISAVVTQKGRIETPVVINAAGSYGRDIGRLLGLSHPMVPDKQEILVTEKYDYIGMPKIYSVSMGTYISQLINGTFIMGWDDPDMMPGRAANIEPRWHFLDEMAQRAIKQIPALKHVRVVRQWAGHYDMTPDIHMLMGGVPEVEGYYLGLGASRAFMIGPALGLTVAEIVAGEPTTFDPEQYTIDRFYKPGYLSSIKRGVHVQ